MVSLVKVTVAKVKAATAIDKARYCFKTSATVQVIVERLLGQFQHRVCFAERDKGGLDSSAIAGKDDPGRNARLADTSNAFCWRSDQGDSTFRRVLHRRCHDGVWLKLPDNVDRLVLQVDGARQGHEGEGIHVEQGQLVREQTPAPANQASTEGAFP